MTHKELLEQFITNSIDFVVIGGIALRLYNSPRLTHDIDLAVRTLDVDIVTELMYRNGYYLITNVGNDSVSIVLNLEKAQTWLTREKAGSASFIQLIASPESTEIPMEKIDLSSQVDILFELGIPIMRLIADAHLVQLGDLSFRVASREDLITLKRLRSDRSAVDEEDIRFLQSLDEDAP